MSSTSFMGKVFVVRDANSRVRSDNNLNTFVKYKAGDAIPPGKAVGDFVTIPVGARVHVLEGKGDSKK